MSYYDFVFYFTLCVFYFMQTLARIWNLNEYFDTSTNIDKALSSDRAENVGLIFLFSNLISHFQNKISIFKIVLLPNLYLS